jgi:hypothetical protein
MKRLLVSALLVVAACGGSTSSSPAAQSLAAVAMASPVGTADSTATPTPEPTATTQELLDAFIAAGDCEGVLALSKSYSGSDTDLLGNFANALIDCAYATPAPTAAPAAAARPVTIKGTSSRKTKPFTLGAGDYTAVVRGRSTGGYGGNVIVDLRSVDGSEDENLTNEIKNGAGSYRYETSVYGLAGGRYYLDVTMPSGTWSVTFTPQA